MVHRGLPSTVVRSNTAVASAGILTLGVVTAPSDTPTHIPRVPKFPVCLAGQSGGSLSRRQRYRYPVGAQPLPGATGSTDDEGPLPPHQHSLGRCGRQIVVREIRVRETGEVQVERFDEKAAAPVAFLDQDWSAKRYSDGGMLSHCPPGVLTEFGPATTKPCGRIHWAGTETSGVMHGWVDGAVRSSERAAKEVIRHEPATVT
ncbi:FAD-dependent oxidoreductase [Mycolicibacterium sarraceniae]|uniref:FAD-dependent oxidoreductase n=1 Tax=Mycolicibacterium sarraceniae TaxID=1534348 RepID=UPI0038995BDF